MSPLKIASLLVNRINGFLEFAQTILKRVENSEHVLGHQVTALYGVLKDCQVLHFLQRTTVQVNTAPSENGKKTRIENWRICLNKQEAIEL